MSCKEEPFAGGGCIRAQELRESRGGRPGLPVPYKPTVSVDVKQHFNLILEKNIFSPLLPGLEPAAFRSRVRRASH